MCYYYSKECVMKTMQEVAYEFLLDKKKAPFNNVWDFVLNTLKKSWIETYPDKTEAKIIEVKIGELYTMLTSDGEFIKDTNDNWTLCKFHTFEDQTKMKINVSGLED